MINCTKFFIMHYVWKIFSCGFQVGVIVARCKICCETANKLTRQYDHVSNSTADYGEYCCELWRSSVVPYCDQCAKWNRTLIFHFMYNVRTVTK